MEKRAFFVSGDKGQGMDSQAISLKKKTFVFIRVTLLSKHKWKGKVIGNTPRADGLERGRQDSGTK
jgi:hypothetical protein